MIVCSKQLRRVSKGHHVPASALVVAGGIPALIALSALWLTNAIATIISFASVGIYVAFQMIVVAALVARARGWRPAGAFTLGRWAWPVNIAALAYGLSAIINMSWPRNPEASWYTNYGVISTTIGVVAAGLAYMGMLRPYDRGRAAAGDAHLLGNGAYRPGGQ